MTGRASLVPALDRRDQALSGQAAPAQAVLSPRNPLGTSRNTRIGRTTVPLRRAVKLLTRMRIWDPSGRQIFILKRFRNGIAPLPAAPARPGRTLIGPGPAIPAPAVPATAVPVLIGRLLPPIPARPSLSTEKAGWHARTPPAAASLARAARVPAANPDHRAPTAPLRADQLPARGTAPALALARIPAQATAPSPLAAPLPDQSGAAARANAPLRRIRPGLTRRALRAHRITAPLRRNRIPAPPPAPKERLAPAGSRDPRTGLRPWGGEPESPRTGPRPRGVSPALAAQANPMAAHTPGPAAFPNPATRASPPARAANAQAFVPVENPVEKSAARSLTR